MEPTVQKFISPNCGQPCTHAQYLAELVVTRKIKKSGQEPEIKFWNSIKWKREFSQQVIAANSLLKIFSIEAILDALNAKDGSWIYSLTYPGLIDLVNRQQIRIETEAKIVEQQVKLDINPNNTQSKPSVIPKPNIRDKLD